MPALYYLNVTVHVLAAMLWLGGALVLLAVIALSLPEGRRRNSE